MSWNQKIIEQVRNDCRVSLAKTPNGDEIPTGRVTPTLEDFALGSAKSVEAAALFFDLRGFTRRINSDNIKVRLEGLAILNAVIPVVSRIICEEGGYVEKNTGDGIMAIIGIDGDDKRAVHSSLVAAGRIFAALDQIVNPELNQRGITNIDARIGIDYGHLLIARIGLPTGTASMDRNFLTAVGATANIACKIQQAAGTNEIWVGDAVKRHTDPKLHQFFHDVTPDDWSWTWVQSGTIYNLWKFSGRYGQPAIG